MIVALFTALFAVFFSGQVDSFYIDQIDKGVKKYVKDDTRKEKINELFKIYESKQKEFNANMDTQLKELKKISQDQTTSRDWYDGELVSLTENRIKLQSEYIKLRLEMVSLIQEDEWAQIISDSKDEDSKDGKDEKKVLDETEKKFSDLKDKIEKVVSEKDKESLILTALSVFEKEALATTKAYQGTTAINKDNSVLTQQDADSKDLQKIGDGLNKLRQNLFVQYTDFIMVLAENTTSDEYKSIIKDIDKALD